MIRVSARAVVNAVAPSAGRSESGSPWGLGGEPGGQGLRVDVGRAWLEMSGVSRPTWWTGGRRYPLRWGLGHSAGAGSLEVVPYSTLAAEVAVEIERPRGPAALLWPRARLHKLAAGALDALAGGLSGTGERRLGPVQRVADSRPDAAGGDMGGPVPGRPGGESLLPVHGAGAEAGV